MAPRKRAGSLQSSAALSNATIDKAEVTCIMWQGLRLVGQLIHKKFTLLYSIKFNHPTFLVTGTNW